MSNINIVFLTNDVIKDKSKILFETLYKKVPELIPDFYGNWEPLKQHFELNNIDSIQKAWQKTPFLWKNKKYKVKGSVWLASTAQKQHHCLNISIDGNEFNTKKLLDFFTEWCYILKPDFACITKLTESEIKNGREADVAILQDKKKQKYIFSITTHQIKKYIPDLYWLTAFGENYINFFGKEKLISTPVYKIIEFSHNIVLQLSKDINDLENNILLIEDIREKTKKYLKNNAFFDKNKSTDEQYSTPWD